jgi:nitrite reductase (NADH) small subunit
METIISTESACYNLGSLERIPPGEGRVFRVSETDIAVFRLRDGKIYATQSTCPHRGGPLADGLAGSGKILCPLHGFAFELATGQPVDNPCAQLRTYTVVVNGTGEILLTLDA